MQVMEVGREQKAAASPCHQKSSSHLLKTDTYAFIVIIESCYSVQLRRTKFVTSKELKELYLVKLLTESSQRAEKISYF